MAAIDRRLDQIIANAPLNAETAALDFARQLGATSRLRSLRVFRIAAEDEIEGLSQRSAADLGRGFVRLLHRSGRDAADRWLRGTTERTPQATAAERQIDAEMQPVFAE